MARHPKSKPKGRKTHRKSRHGCANCKRRRIKCDEQKPACSNCIGRSIQCIFISEAPPIHLAGKRSSPSTNIIASPPPHDATSPLNVNNPINPNHHTLDIPALSLLQHWTLHTCTTLSPDPESQECWRTNIPRLGFAFDFVLQGLLALSALHLAHLHHPHDHDDDPHHHYSATSARHWDAALRGASAALAGATAAASSSSAAGHHHPDDTICALYAFAVTSCFYTLARGPQQAGDMLVCVVDDAGSSRTGGGGGGSTTTTADWLTLYHGVRSLIELSSDRVLDGPLAPLSSHARRQLRRNRRSKPGGGGGGGITTAAAEEGEGERGKEGGGSGGSAALRELRLHMDDDEPNLGTYEKAVDSLDFAWEVVEAEERRGGGGALAASFQAFFWLYRVSDDFVLCLQQRQPMALVIYAHFVVLLKTMDWTWIIGCWPSHLMAQIYGSLDESWRVRVRWPMEQVGWQP